MVLRRGIDYTEICTDLDGVQRGLDIAALGRRAKTWNETNAKGKTVSQIIDENPELILKAPKLEYCEILYMLPQPITIITHQHKSWIPYTEKWVKNNLGDLEIKIIYVDNYKEKLGYLNDGRLLLEDHPKFSDYRKIVLVQRDYTRHLESKVPHYVQSPQELIELLGL